MKTKNMILGMATVLAMTTFQSAFAVGTARESSSMTERILEKIKGNLKSLKGVDATSEQTLRDSLSLELSKGNSLADKNAIADACRMSFSYSDGTNTKTAKVVEIAKRTQNVKEEVDQARDSDIKSQSERDLLEARREGVNLQAQLLGMLPKISKGTLDATTQQSVTFIQKLSVVHQRNLESGAAKDIQATSAVIKATVDAQVNETISTDKAARLAMNKMYKNEKDADAKMKELLDCE